MWLLHGILINIPRQEFFMKPSTSMTLAEQLETLKMVTIFAGFTDEELRHICNSCMLFEAPKGEVIISEGSEASEILILLKGTAAIVLDIKNDPIEIMEFGPGSCIGEASVIGIQPHSASVVVVKDTVLMVLYRQVLMHLFNHDKQLFSLLILNIARELARRLHHTDTLLLQYGRMNKSYELMHPGVAKETAVSAH